MSSCGCLSIAGKEVLDCLVKPLAQQPQIEDVEDWVSRRVSIETAERDIQQMDVTVIVVRNQQLAATGLPHTIKEGVKLLRHLIVCQRPLAAIKERVDHVAHEV